MKPYPKYKPSDIQWLGDIPEHWKIRKVSRSFDIIGSGTTPSADNKNFYQDGTINWINTGDLNDGLLESCNKKITQSAFEGHSTLKIYPKGTLLIAMYGATIGKTSILGIEGCTNQACCALANSPYFEMQFAFYWFLANKEHIINLGYGGGQPNISQEVIRFLKITCPPLPEQTAIAQFLDQKTAQIDTLIAQKQRLITLLKEERMAFINEILSDESFPLKKLKYVAEMTSGFAFSSDDFVPEGVQLIKISGLYQNQLSLERQPTFLPIDFLEKYENWVITKGDILMSMTGTLGKRDYGFAILLEEEDKYFLNQRVSKLNFNPNMMDTKFGLFTLRGEYYQEQLFQLPSGTKQGNLSNEQVLSISVPCPPLETQQKIVESIETTTGKIDATLAKIVQEIELLKEYRVALISEVVTGKVSVV